MRLRKLISAAAFSLVVSAAVYAAEPISQTGEENFEQFCAACHGSGAKGNGPVASSLKKPMPDLTMITNNNDGEFPYRKIRSTIDGRWDIEAHGTEIMPVWGYEFWVADDSGNFDEDNVSKILDGLV
ncbi:MAG: cytochrome c, partial [Gammaproteobacteria bacterium]|nr:cytochrome c [Gammaproteobacteria bacterium]